MSKKGKENSLQAFLFFHFHVGIRVSLRLFIPLVAAFFFLYYVLSYEFFLSFMATALDSGILLSGLFTIIICVVIAKFASRRICLGLGGWIKNQKEQGATVVVVSHTIEPFIQLASEAVTLKSSKAFRFKELPAS